MQIRRINFPLEKKEWRRRNIFYSLRDLVCLLSLSFSPSLSLSFSLTLTLISLSFTHSFTHSPYTPFPPPLSASSLSIKYVLFPSNIVKMFCNQPDMLYPSWTSFHELRWIKVRKSVFSFPLNYLKMNIWISSTIKPSFCSVYFSIFLWLFIYLFT